jgi:hypothetical protein
MKLTPYEQFSADFYATINSDKFTNQKIKIFQLQTGAGKSHFQNVEMPLMIKEAFPQLKYIFRLSPTREVAFDGTFENIDIQSNSKTKYRYLPEPQSHVLTVTEDVADDVVYCISITHTYFTTHFDRLLRYAENSILCIEEAHQFTGCGDAGKEAYTINFGYDGEYTAATAEKVREWHSRNPRVIGFTATTTLHHQGDEALSPLFEICSDLAKLEDLLPVQCWLNKDRKYHFVKENGKESIKHVVQNSIDSLFEREEQLLELKEKLKNNDKNINTKLTGLFIAGNARGIWGCPINEVKDVISEYLLSVGYSESERMIATMVDDSNGGIKIHSLDGTVCEKIDSASELFEKLQSEKNPLRYLIVINRGRSGINVHNFSAEVICRIRDPKEIRSQIPIQIFGRMVRTNVGTGDIIRKKYKNSLKTYLENYPKDYNVDINTVVETIKISNIFDIWYPDNPKTKRTWETALLEFKEFYINIKDDGYEFLSQYGGFKKPIFQQNQILNSCEDLKCPVCGSPLKKSIEEWFADGTLNPFFNI